jgi:hypothetical protein
MLTKKILIGLLALLAASLACGMLDQAVDSATGGDQDMTRVESLWSDVPPMDGMGAAQQIEMPALIKAVARPMMDAMMRGLNDGADAGHWDWTGFMLTDKTPADVQAFYSPERMTAFGWQPAQAACLPMSDSGVMCSFTKEDAGISTGLMIIAAADEQKGETSLFFLRSEGLDAEGPAPGQPAQSSAPLSLSPIAPITLTGDLTQIDLCQAIPPQDIEAVLGRSLAKAPERFTYYDTPASSGCSYDGEKDADGEAHYGYVALTPVDAYNTQPLYLNVPVSGLGQEAYFNNGADTRQLWVKVNDNAAFVVAFGDIANEDYERAIAELLLAAIQ